MSAAREPLAPDAIEHLTAEIYEDANGQGWHSATSAEQAEYRAKVKRWLGGVSLLRAPQSGPWTWDTAPAALKQIRADAMRLGKAGERIVLLVDTLVPRVQHVNAAGSGAETPPQPETEK